MLRLLLMRHAKSSWDNPETDDYERTLNERGRQAAPTMGAFMAQRDLIPDRILCSAARRARETLALLLPHLSGNIDICITERLYQSDAPGYLTAVREYGGTDLTVLLIGHNPAMEDFAHILAPMGDAAGLASMKAKYPTCGLAIIGFDLPHWRDIGPAEGRLISFHTPKTIGTDEA